MARHACQFTIAVLTLLFVLSVNPATGARPKPTPQSGKGKIYTAYNLWFEKAEKIPCINYKSGGMLPVGTEVSGIEVAGSKRGKPIIILTTAEGHGRYTIYFEQKFHPGMTPEAFMERMVTKKPLEKLTEGLTEKEIKAVKEGRLTVGMCKKAVVMSRGYPPEHRTPSLEVNTWLYWQSRFKTKQIEFDEKGQTRRPSYKEDDF